MKKNVLTLGRIFGLCLLVSALIVLAGCQAKPDAVATKLAEAVNGQDLDGALALFADDAVVNSGGPEPFTGKAEIQSWLEGMFADNFKIEIEILEVSEDKVVERDTMSMDSLSALGIATLEGTSEITVQGGKITALNFTFTDESLAELQVAMLKAAQAKPDAVATKLAEAVNAQDLDGALALFADDAVVNSGGPEPFTGKAEIQGWLEGMFADNFEIEIEILQAEGDTVVERDVMSMDSLRYLGIASLEGTSEIAVQGGKITALDFTFTEDSLAKLQAAPFVTREDLIGAWSMGGTFIQFYENGTTRVADSPDDLSAPVDESHPGAWERWSYDGTVFTIQMTAPGVGEGRTCPLDAVGTYMVKRVGDDRLKFKAIEDPCASRRVGLPWGEWRPYSP